jgi:hypothetical protein
MELRSCAGCACHDEMKSINRQTIRFLGGAAIVIAVLFVLNLIVAAPGTSRRQVIYPTGTTYSDAWDGAELVYRLFEELGFGVTRHRYPLVGDRVPTRTDIIWHAWSAWPVGMDEIEWIDDWVRRGGTLVLIDNPLRRSLGMAESSGVGIGDILLDHWLDRLGLKPVIRNAASIMDSDEDSPHRQLLVDPGTWGLGDVHRIHSYKRSGLIAPLVYRLDIVRADVKNPTPVIRDSFGTLVAWSGQGSGRVWIVADPYLFSNLLIQETDNALLAVTMISRSGESPAVLFDEYHLGYVRTRTLADAARTPLGKGILYIGMIVALALGSAGARFGPIRKAPGAVGVSQRAFVRALATLWQGAGATTAVGEALWRRYASRQAVRRRHLDTELDRMRKSKPRPDELIEIAGELDK